MDSTLHREGKIQITVTDHIFYNIRDCDFYPRVRRLVTERYHEVLYPLSLYLVVLRHI